ncbi:MAG: hypothetical protein KAR85_00685 [Methanosarcinales archaeon]|nr:hypothetical protein [Methanosarcinales archaeon]
MTENDLQKFKKNIIPLDSFKKSEWPLKYGISLTIAYKGEIITASMAPKGKKEEMTDLVILAFNRRPGLHKLTEGSMTEDFIRPCACGG